MPGGGSSDFEYVAATEITEAEETIDQVYESFTVDESALIVNTGDAVTNLQRRLWQLGYLIKGDVKDSIGTFNDATRQAVVDAQLKMGYGSADGVAGVEFQSFLYSKYGDKLIVLSRGNTWHKVRVVRTGVEGYMYGKYIRFAEYVNDYEFTRSSNSGASQRWEKHAFQ